MQETPVQFLGWKNPPKEGVANHSGILAWRIPWTEEPGGLQRDLEEVRERHVGAWEEAVGGRADTAC